MGLRINTFNFWNLAYALFHHMQWTIWNSVYIYKSRMHMIFTYLLEIPEQGYLLIFMEKLLEIIHLPWYFWVSSHSRSTTSLLVSYVNFPIVWLKDAPTHILSKGPKVFLDFSKTFSWICWLFGSKILALKLFSKVSEQIEFASVTFSPLLE